ncbi:hypothetical protein SK854_14465 [Lentzea sp. BCCO 10_0061]|uniref:Uncharacterized protein n=1 Tax=Lentzea sokolovensis TaxID=3095429 RepID=A0ABU4UX15_9PSEU|nr:hypothetical protein [Lentzea sp. BCCO 10_0061]MDX8143328.1 hypothetical protein [Lentzea sp. BCCO 10_0061]
MFLIERNLKNQINSAAIERSQLLNPRIRVDEKGSQVVAMVRAATREQAESIATEILGE